MVTYDFYKNSYLGSALSEAAFPQAAARAEEWLERLERSCSVASCGPDSRAMAVCALAESMDVLRKKQNIAQTSIGGVSVRYETGSHRLMEQQLLRAAGVYLDIYRGVD